MREGLILKLSCPDKHGLVAQIANHASEFSANLVEFNQFTEQKRGVFYSRLEIDTESLEVSIDDFIAVLRFWGGQLKPTGTSADYHTK